MPDGILACVPHEIARYGAQVSKKTNKKKGEGVIHMTLKSCLLAKGVNFIPTTSVTDKFQVKEFHETSEDTHIGVLGNQLNDTGHR